MKDAQTEPAENDPFVIEETEPYAELWLGTHPSGMSRVSLPQCPQQRSLLEYVGENPKLHCGNPNVSDLSFLLKVLSVRKVLSIQAHPDKQLAEKLHRERPHIYKDPNHKPEMAIALSERVRAMCGFRPVHEIVDHLREYPEFRALIGTDVVARIERAQSMTDPRDALQNMFHAYIEADEQRIQEQVERMIERLRPLEGLNDVQKLMLQLEEQFPGDCGIFAPLIFNLVELKKGQGLFIAANEPHAYVSGEILECMACSDNVVRAGLTPKLKDVHTLVNMLTYNTNMPEIHAGASIDECTTRYQPPVRDFCVECIQVPPGQSYEILRVDSPSVLLTLEGDGTLEQGKICQLDVSFGYAAFCSANTQCTIVAGPYGVRLTRAFTNVYHGTEQ